MLLDNLDYIIVRELGAVATLVRKVVTRLGTSIFTCTVERVNGNDVIDTHVKMKRHTLLKGT